LAVGAAWVILDWVNFTAIPFWGMAQSFARAWTAYPFAIQFISITGITGILFVIGTLSGLAAHAITLRSAPRPVILTAIFSLLLLVIIDTFVWIQKPVATVRVAAAGWVFDESTSELNPNEAEGFEEWFAVPARQAAAQGAHIFTTGEMGFYIADHERKERIEQFARIARDNNLWLIIGYFNVTVFENRLFFMSPEGEVVHEYTKVNLIPFEPGQKGDGDLKTVEVDGLTIGAMVCQDDNLSKLTRHYGKLKADVVFSPTEDWTTVKYAHLQAVRARAIENNYGIARGCAGGISAIISPRGKILAKIDHYNSGPGFVIADIPAYKRKTIFAYFGHGPSLVAAGVCIGLCEIYRRKEKRRLFSNEMIHVYVKEAKALTMH
jgi:apolipoprotein N-acyltransferase